MYIKRITQIFILGLILVSMLAAEVQAAAKKPIYLSFEQRLVVSYALLAQGESEAAQNKIIQRMIKIKNKYADVGEQIVEVSSFEDFLKAYRGDWPNTNSLDADLKIIENESSRGIVVYRAKSARIQAQIDKYMNETVVEHLVEATNLSSLLNKNSVSKTLSLFNDKNSILNLNDSAVAEILKYSLFLSDKIISEQIKQLDGVGNRLSKMNIGSENDKMMKIVLQTMLSDYFANLDISSKKLIVGSYLGENLVSNDFKKFEIMVQNSGPIFQKMLQIIARQGDLNPEMKDVFKTLEDSVKSVPWTQVKELLKSESQNYDFEYFERKPIGVGTMAQVHRAKLIQSGKKRDVVVRFIKPDIEKRIQEDHRILTKIAGVLDANPDFRETGAPQISPIVEDTTKTVLAELDQVDTIKRQKIGEKVYNQELMFEGESYKNFLKIHVPKIYSSKSDSKLMVQELILGTKLDKEVATYKEQIPDLKKILIENISKIWIQEVIFGSGFFHSDLHQGNFLVRVTDPEIQVNILDFGMGGKIDSLTQKNILLLGAGIELMNSAITTRAFWDISDQSKNQITRDELEKRISVKFKELSKNREALSTELWTAWVMDQGLRLPYEFINLNRGLVIISKMLKDSGSPLAMKSIIKELAPMHAEQMIDALIKHGGLSLKDLTKLGWSQYFKASETKVITDLSAKKSSVNSAIRCEQVFLN